MFLFLETALAPLIFTAIGGFLLVLSFILRRRTKRFIRESVQTQGEVIGLHEVYDEGSYTYAPIVRFIAADGITREFTDSMSSRPPRHNVGDRITILYHRQNPRDARVATTFRLYFASTIVGSIGAVFFCIGGALSLWLLFSEG